MENLLTDIIEDIFSRLPVEPTLLRCKRVCRTWRELLRKYKTGVLFAYESEGKIQLYYGDQDEVTLESYYSSKTLTKFENVKLEYSYYDNDYMVSSCNGLVCVVSGICNPVTGEFLSFPDTKPLHIAHPSGIGFGYLPSTNEYKVVRTGYSNKRREGLVEVYTLGSQSGWRRKPNIPYRFSRTGVFVNGAIHWMRNPHEKPGGYQYKIFAFDLADENFKDVPLPSLYKHNAHAELMLLGGNLCFIHYRSSEEIIDIWAFKRNTTIRLWPPTVERGKYYDDNWSWTRDFRLPATLLCSPFAITKSNEILARGHRQQQLYCCNAKRSTKRTKSWDGGEKSSSCVRAIPHVNTLVSLKELGECSGKYGDKSATLKLQG